MTIKKIDLERLMFIEALLLVNGELRRSELMERFGISTKTASLLIRSYEDNCPGQLFLDNKPKRPLYYSTKTCKPCLFTTAKEAKQYLVCSNKLNNYLKETK